MTFFFLLLIVYGLAVNLDETIKFHHFALGNKLLVATADTNVYGSFLYLGICHLTGYRALPDQFVELTLLGGTLDFRTLHIGGTDGLVSLLGTL